MSKFTPMDDTAYNDHKREQAMRFVWPAGWYEATVSDAEDGCTERVSNAGNLMFETKFQVFNSEGKMKKITAYVMADGKTAFQLRACAEAFGVLDEYKAGTLSEDDLKGKSGFVKLSVETDPTGTYEPKNVIKDYKNALPGTVARPVTEKRKYEIKTSKADVKPDDLDDSIPF